MHGFAPVTAVTSALTLLAAAVLGGCAGTPAADGATDAARWAALLDRLQPADVVLLGEQHDAPDHPVWQRAAVAHLAGQGRLAALALEMAPAGRSTAGLPAAADEQAVRTALDWDHRAWPWPRYGPMVMQAVRAQVPVLGANLPRSGHRDAMNNAALDDLLPLAMWRKQQEAIRQGHCGLLPEARVVPMTRIQLARDAAMAATVRAAARPGQSVLLIAGNQHVDRSLGVPAHGPVGGTLRSVALLPAGTPPVQVDRVWTTAPAPAVDHCDALRRQWSHPTAAPR